MLTQRLIVCLDVRDGRVVKGVQFVNLRDVGDAVALSQRYEQEGADEVVFLDIAASPQGRGTLFDVVSRTADVLFIPLTVGGGVRSVDDVGAALRAGADKVSVNSAAVRDPSLLTRCAERFGAQCVVVSIDAKQRENGSGWQVVIEGGRTPTALDAVEWAARCAELGAGEVLLTSIDRDGARSGYDLALTSAVSAAVTVPVIASGGAGSAAHVCDAVTRGGADAALVAGILHDGVTSVEAIKRAMAAAEIPVRETWA